MAENGSDSREEPKTPSENYKEEPTLENYLRLRRLNPDAEIEVAVFGGVDQLFYMEPELEKYGISALTMASAMDADPEAISEISLHLLEKIVEANALRKAGETQLIRRGLAVPDKLVDWFIATSLDAMSWTDQLTIPRDLIVLIRERLGGVGSEYEKAADAHLQKQNAIIIGSQLHAAGIKPTLRLIGRFLQVSPSTIMRWFEPGEFEQLVAKKSLLIDVEGSCLDGSAKPVLQSNEDAQQEKD